MADDNSEWKFAPTDQSQNQPQPGQVVSGGQADGVDPPPETQAAILKWQAPDSYSPGKTASWYLGLLLITVVLSAAAYLLTGDKITTGVIAACGLLFGVYAAKKPRLLNYEISQNGFAINGRYHAFADYRSYAIVRHQGGGLSAVLTPLKRFLPYSYIYFTVNDELKITAILADSLAQQNAHTDIMDRMLRKIGF